MPKPYPSKSREYVRAYRAANRDKLNAQQKARRDAAPGLDAERMRNHRAANPGSNAEVCRRWYAKNRERQLAKLKAYDQENGHKRRARYANNPKLRAAAVAHAVARHIRKQQRCPAWVDMRAIRAIYRKCPKGWHVDHIVPLHGVTPGGRPVSGLHVPWNLQYLPGKENRSKWHRMRLHELLLVLNIKPEE